MAETTRHLDFAARWIRDGLSESTQAGAFEIVHVDVSDAAQVLKRLTDQGWQVTWTHIFVRAAALALARNPDLHRVVAGNKTVHSAGVDICLSIAGDSCVTPVVVIEDAANKDIFAIGAEIRRRSPEAVKETERLLSGLRRWGWILPLSVWRRGLLRFLLRRLWYRRKVSGTFQISCVPQVDVIAPLLFNTCAALGIGRVREAVVAENGTPAVRPVVTLTCCLDHSMWNGLAAAKFLSAFRQILVSGDFAPQFIAIPNSIRQTNVGQGAGSGL